MPRLSQSLVTMAVSKILHVVDIALCIVSVVLHILDIIFIQVLRPHGLVYQC